MMAVDHAEHGPVRAGIAHLREITPRQGNAVPAIHGTQITGWVGIEEVPVRIGRDFRHATHDDRGSQLELRSGLDAIALTCEEAPERRTWREQGACEEAA